MPDRLRLCSHSTAFRTRWCCSSTQGNAKKFTASRPVIQLVVGQDNLCSQIPCTWQVHHPPKKASLASFTEKGPALLGFAIFRLAAVTSSGEISWCVRMAAESSTGLLRLVTFGHIGAECRLVCTVGGRLPDTR